MKDSYNNPFSGVNAVQLDTDSILEYWCSPFGYLPEIKEEDIFEDPNNIVLMGGRSTGKSMFLRYWSYPIQMRISEKRDIPFSQIIQENKGVGFYFRIDGAKLKSFQGFGLTEEYWTSVFTHYFELIVGRQYIEFLSTFISKEDVDSNELEKLTTKLCSLLCMTSDADLNTIVAEFDKKIKEVEIYMGNVPFYKNEFIPQQGFSSQYLSFGIPELLLSNLSLFTNKNIIIFLDEYENFLDYQQKTINTLLRFTKPHIKFRIGMRLEGFRTFAMISEADFIKEGREYRKVVFEEIVNKSKDYQTFLFEISKKRLEGVPYLKEKGFTDIRKILGDRENLEQESLELALSQPHKTRNHFKKISDEDFEKIKCPENPLLELMNCIWVTNRKISVEKTQMSMNDYLSGNNSEDGRKYKNDYINKYKLSLMFLLCSIYHKNKQYYSFNTFSFLSSGIVGHFIELCRRTFDIATWGDQESLLCEGVIKKEFQNKAATDFSNSEKQQIGRIETYGGTISKFIENIGNIFREYHLDFQMKYPETNQFAINIDSIQETDLQNAIKTAIRWTVIQRKPKMQRTGPSENLQDIYTINRILSPSFQISYRTRGGKSVVIDNQKLKKLMTEEKIKLSDYIVINEDGEAIESKKTDVKKNNFEQPNLFSEYE